ncbi:MAG: NADH-quinone oxidoreductase subunit M [Phycisphaerales bacterium]
MAAILIPLVSAVLIALAPEARAKTIALLGAMTQLVVACYAATVFDWSFSSRAQLGMSLAWFDGLGVNLSLGADGVSMVLILLTGLLGPVCVLASSTAITTRVRTYYAWLVVLQAAMAGVFAARDVILFYICFEFTLIPMFILISLWGSTNRRRAAIKFFLFTFTGSVVALAGLVYVTWFNATLDRASVPAVILSQHELLGTWTFDVSTLITAGQLMSATEQAWVLLALMAGFAVKVPLFPVHTWLPLAHTEAPTAGSVILAGVLLKLGTYAIYRFALPMVPEAVATYAPHLSMLCVVGIIYGGLICWVQTDVKKLVAYSSVAHLGFCMLGMFALNNTGITGSILYMVNHGLSTGALFLLIGMIYERYHTRDMNQLGGLAAKMPVWATFMVFFTMASVGLPGLNGFVSEFLCLLGAFQASSSWGSGAWGSNIEPVAAATPGALGPWFAMIAGTGMIIAAMYLLYMVGKVVWGPLKTPHGHSAGHAEHSGHGASHGSGGAGGHGSEDEHAHGLPTDLSGREIMTLVPLAVLCIVLGVYPKPLMQAVQGSVDQTVAVVRTPLRSRGATPAPARHAPQPTNPANTHGEGAQ